MEVTITEKEVNFRLQISYFLFTVNLENLGYLIGSRFIEIDLVMVTNLAPQSLKDYLEHQQSIVVDHSYQVDLKIIKVKQLIVAIKFWDLIVKLMDLLKTKFVVSAIMLLLYFAVKLLLIITIAAVIIVFRVIITINSLSIKIVILEVDYYFVKIKLAAINLPVKPISIIILE